MPRDPVDALIISQVMTLGKGTTGAGANTVGPDGGLYTSQAQTGLANNGYGAITSGTRPTDIDLSTYGTGFSSVSPTYTVTGVQNGTVALQSDGHTARFQPTTGCHGLSSFAFTVKGSDGTAYTSEVVVLVAP